MSYQAIVARIHTRPLPGADRLVIGTCGNYQVIVGIDTKDGELGVFFESDGQLSEEFATQNDLVRRKNDDGSAAGGMFEPNRRVKAIKLRGAKSEGFWCPLDKVAYTGVSLASLTEGTQFDALNGRAICNKYFTPATQRSGKARYKVQRDNVMFHKHIDTGLFKREAALIPAGSQIWITEKLHGTSQRVGRVLDEQPIQRSWFGALVGRLFGWPTTRKDWTQLIGTRNVILEHKEGGTFYGDEAFRYTVSEGVALHKGEVIYGEVVGYTHNGNPIMSTQDTSGLKDKQITAAFGKTMTYSYGCHVGQCAFYVYRITHVNEDGQSVELSWQQVKKRSREFGLNVVPELATLTLDDRDRDGLAKQVAVLTETADGVPYPSLLDARHIREGVVVRYESEHGTGWMKNKAFSFGVMEGYLKDNAEFVDTEEAATV